MRAKYLGILAAIVFVAATAGPVLAHHSFVAEFDDTKPVTLVGSVTKVEWTNPHAWVHIDVKDSAGAVTPWRFELGSPNTLIRYGWTRNMVKPGDTVTVEGFQGRHVPNIANAKTVKFADGRTFNAGSSVLSSVK